MTTLFYVSAAVAIISGLMVITRTNAMHALVNLVVMFLAISSIFWTLGAPFAAVLQIVVYAGAIMILFVFVVMILNLGRQELRREHGLVYSLVWIVPVVLTAILLSQFVVAITSNAPGGGISVVSAKAVGISLFTTYVIAVEIASMMLLAALVAAYHFGAYLAMREAEDE